MSYNPNKCKAGTYLQTYSSEGNINSQYNPVFDIPQWSSLVLLGVTIQSYYKFREHVDLKLINANKCLHVPRTLRKEQYSPAEIDHLFTFLVLPSFSYGLSVYGASQPDLNISNCLDVIRAVLFLTPFSLRIY